MTGGRAIPTRQKRKGRSVRANLAEPRQGRIDVPAQPFAKARRSRAGVPQSRGSGAATASYGSDIDFDFYDEPRARAVPLGAAPKSASTDRSLWDRVRGPLVQQYCEHIEERIRGVVDSFRHRLIGLTQPKETCSQCTIGHCVVLLITVQAAFLAPIPFKTCAGCARMFRCDAVFTIS